MTSRPNWWLDMTTKRSQGSKVGAIKSACWNMSIDPCLKLMSVLLIGSRGWTSDGLLPRPDSKDHRIFYQTSIQVTTS